MARMLKFFNGNMVEYEVLKLVDYYDPILRTPTIPWDFTRPEKEAEFIAFSLTETLERQQGLGLSANQVGLRDRVCAINAGKEFWIMFNPKIINKSNTESKYSEGCLSYPGLFLHLQRSDRIVVEFQAIGGQLVQKEVDGLTAVCIQHEIDHLDGILYTDRVHPIHLEKAKRKIKKNLKRIKLAATEGILQANL